MRWEGLAHLRHVHEAGPGSGDEPQGLNGAVHQLRQDVTGGLRRLRTAVHLRERERLRVLMVQFTS